MLKVFFPSNGKKKGVDFSNVGNKFFWCNCENPTLVDFKKISKKTGINIDDLKRYSVQKEAKIIIRKDYDIFLFKYPSYESGKVVLKNLELIFNKKFVITVYDDGIDTLDEFVKNIDTELIGVKKVDYFYFLHRILVSLIKYFFIVLDKIESNLERLEDSVLKSKTNMNTVFFVRKNLLQVRKALVLNRNILVDLQQGDSKYLLFNMVSDIYNSITKILENEELLRDRLTNMLELHLSYVSNRMNDLMKSFSIIATALLIPMLVSSIYGMNIKLPIQEHPYAFYTVMLLSLLSVVSSIYYFRRKKWL